MFYIKIFTIKNYNLFYLILIGFCNLKDKLYVIFKKMFLIESKMLTVDLWFVYLYLHMCMDILDTLYSYEKNWKVK